MEEKRIFRSLLTALIFLGAVSLTSCQLRNVAEASDSLEIPSSPKLVFEVVSEETPKPSPTIPGVGQSVILKWPTAAERYWKWPFGVKTDYQDSHTGLDFKVSYGKPIYSVGDGVVVFTGWFPQTPEYNYPNMGHGNTVWVLHGFLEDQRPLYSVYAHLSSFSVKAGEKVVVGHQVGLCGSTGAGDGPHLHFAIRLGGGFQYGRTDANGRSWIDGQWVNPDEWVGRTLNLRW